MYLRNYCIFLAKLFNRVQKKSIKVMIVRVMKILEEDLDKK